MVGFGLFEKSGQKVTCFPLFFDFHCECLEKSVVWPNQKIFLANYFCK